MNFLPTHPHLELIAILTAVMLFAFWLVYCMGGPLSDNIRDVDIRGIFFFFPWWLARKRMIQWHIDQDARKELRDELQITDGARNKLQATREWKRRYFETARDFFGWERSLLCPICLHWWLTVIVVTVLFATGYWSGWPALGLCGVIYLVNHFFIRKIS